MRSQLTILWDIFRCFSFWEFVPTSSVDENWLVRIQTEFLCRRKCTDMTRVKSYVTLRYDPRVNILEYLLWGYYRECEIKWMRLKTSRLAETGAIKYNTWLQQFLIFGICQKCFREMSHDQLHKDSHWAIIHLKNWQNLLNEAKCRTALSTVTAAVSTHNETESKI